MYTWIIFPALGALVGTLSGLLGIGGGIILVPMLAMLFPILGIERDIAIHLALGTSLACTSLTLLSSSLAHKKNGSLDTEIFYQFLPGIILGATIGPYIVHLLPSVVLKYIIGLLLLSLAINMAFDYEIPSHRKMPNKYILMLSSFFISLLASFSGLSGSILIVPYLVWFGIPMRQSVGTAAMCGLPLSVVGMISYMIVGFGLKKLPFGAVGYVYWPAVLVIALTSVPMARLAATYSLKLPKEIIKRLLALLLGFVSAKILFF